MEDYIMGLMSADGYVKESITINKNKRYDGTIEMSERQILEDISKKYNKELFYRNRIIANKERHFYKIYFSREDLKNVGKYLIKGRPNIYEYYKNCNKVEFIRGYFDGDGTIAIRKSGQITIGFSINNYSPDLIKIIEDFAEENNFNLSKYFDKRGNGSWFITINRKKDIIKFRELIYSNDPDLYLKRKKDKFYEIKTD